MIRKEVSERELKKHPTNANWTMPKSWGVWELPMGSNGKRYRYGNFPVRGIELERQVGSVKRIALYTSRHIAKEHSVKLNS